MCKTIDSRTTPATESISSPALSLSLLPDVLASSSLCQSAISLAKRNLPLPILYHSLRVFYYAWHLAKYDTPNVFLGLDSMPDFKDDSNCSLLFTACILHDIGTCATYDGKQRFEVEGADAAVTLLLSHGVPSKDAYDVWVAIALHTSPGIGERIGVLANLVRRGVLIDFGKYSPKLGNETDGPQTIQQHKTAAEREWPRLDIEKVLGDAVVEQAVRQPHKAPPASWPGILYRAYLAEPEWDGINKAF